MKKISLADYNFDLPEGLIAKEPVRPRDHSRLLVLDRQSGNIQHQKFYEIIDFLKKGDLLVMNDSKVFPARLIGKRPTGGRVEILLDKKLNGNTHEAIGKNLKVGESVIFPLSRLMCTVLSLVEGVYQVRFNMSGQKLLLEIEKIGFTPLPPYILKARGDTQSISEDKSDYQTVYAKTLGSSAAPTAGLHFSKLLLEAIKAKGVEIEKVTLHVGLGTFTPIKEEDVTQHQIHSEYYSVEPKAWQAISAAKKAGRRVIAIGTTTTRVLETINASDQLKGLTDIFIYPGYKFKCIDVLITNFHIPKSSLLLLVSAFATKDLIDKAYAEAIKQNYRFYSFGDAMLIK